jgi:hypothetical protein
MILINVVVKNGLVDYNILLGCDFINSMNFVVSSLFKVMIFLHEGCIIAIDQLSYIDPHPIIFLENKIAHIRSMLTSTPPKNYPMPLEPPPHHLGLEAGRIHSSLGEYMHVSSAKPKINHEISTTFFP